MPSSDCSTDHLKSIHLCIFLLSSLGFLILLKNSISLLKWFFITFLRPPKNLKNYGSWALITGSTDGIGKALAFQLAHKGLNLILISRNSNKLKQVSSQLQVQYPNIDIKVIVLNFSGDVVAGVREMKKTIKELEVGVLINNVGVTYPKAMYFDEVDEEVWRNVVRVNLEGTTLVTRAVLPGMIKRRRGAIVNIGSGAAIVVPSHPLYTIYAATKAAVQHWEPLEFEFDRIRYSMGSRHICQKFMRYVDQLSRCLYVEYRNLGIDVQCQVPLYVSTKMVSKIAMVEKSSIFIPSAEKYARAAVKQIGYEARCMPYWGHSVQWFFASLLPDFVLDAWRLSIGIRRRGELENDIPFNDYVCYQCNAVI